VHRDRQCAENRNSLRILFSKNTEPSKTFTSFQTVVSRSKLHESANQNGVTLKPGVGSFKVIENGAVR